MYEYSICSGGGDATNSVDTLYMPCNPLIFSILIMGIIFILNVTLRTRGGTLSPLSIENIIEISRSGSLLPIHIHISTIRFFHPFFFAGIMWRLLELTARFLPCLMSMPLLITSADDVWWSLVASALEKSGTVWIKLGQWMASRIDIFPEKMCSRLSLLQDQVPPEPTSLTLRTIELNLQGLRNKNPENDALANDIDTILAEFNPIPMAAGSIAQVHSSQLHKGTKVAIKILRTGVREQIAIDIKLLMLASRFLSKLPNMKYLSVNSTVMEFCMMLASQLDLRIEARNISVYQRMFDRSRLVKFPEVIDPLTTHTILVEKREYGQTLSALERRRKFQEYSETKTRESVGRKARESEGRKARESERSEARQLDLDGAKRLIMHTYCKMLIHNFAHADLHPGNVIFRRKKSNFTSGFQIRSDFDAKFSDLEEQGLEVVILDCGLVATLPKKELSVVISMLNDTLNGRCSRAANTFMSTCKYPSLILRPQELRGEVERFLKRTYDRHTGGGISYLESLSRLAEIRKTHRFTMRTNYSPFIVSSLVVEGTCRGSESDETSNLSVIDALCDAVGEQSQLLGEIVGSHSES
ncbi:hypothetical protein AAMO2058_001439700 [Amorphochlora amoebiformis]